MVGSRPDEVAGATYYELRGLVKRLLRSVIANVGIGSSTAGGACPSKASRRGTIKVSGRVAMSFF